MPKKKTKPFSIRLSIRERKKLENLAGKIPVSTYIRSRLFPETSLTSRDDKKLDSIHQIYPQKGPQNCAPSSEMVNSIDGEELMNKYANDNETVSVITKEKYQR